MPWNPDDRWPYWIAMSINDAMRTRLTIPFIANGITEDKLFYEAGFHQDIKEKDERIEVQIAGPDITHKQGTVYDINLQIRLMIQVVKGHRNKYRPYELLGVAMKSLFTIPVFDFSLTDPDYSATVQFCLKPEDDTIKLRHFGQVDESTEMIQAAATGDFYACVDINNAP